MQNIIPHAMAYFTVDGQTPEGHNQLGFHGCNLFNEQETASIKSAVTVLNRYFTNLHLGVRHQRGQTSVKLGKFHTEA